MHDKTTTCQLGATPRGETSTIAPPADGTPCLIRSHAAQHIDNTTSRRTGPRRWLRAVHWTINAGHHPKANATTLRIAEDLADRMDYDLGHARYCLDDTAARLGINKSTVKRHTAHLRELGLLAWVVVGSRTNIRRALGLPGYAATATVYAAVIPPIVDQAMGRTRIGTGYTARVIVDLRGCDTTSRGVSETVPPTTPERSCAPPSLTVVKESPSVQVESGFKDTSRKRASRSTTPPQSSPKTKSASNRNQAARRSPLQVAQDIRIARLVRPRVQWTQSEGLRRLAFALRPLIDRGLDHEQIVVELHSWMLTWRPAKPAAYIGRRLTDHAVVDAAEAIVRREAAELAAAAVPPNGDFLTALAAIRTPRSPAPAPALEAAPAPDAGQSGGIEDLTRDEVLALRADADQDPDLIGTSIAIIGEPDTRRLYTNARVNQYLNIYAQGAAA